MTKLSTHVTLEWLENQQVLLVLITNTARTDLDLYLDWITHLMATWNLEQTFFICYDLSLAAPTPYARDILIHVGEVMPFELKGRTAIVLSSGFLGQAISHLFNRYVPITTQIMQRQFFVEREAALAWLREGIPLENASS